MKYSLLLPLVLLIGGCNGPQQKPTPPSVATPSTTIRYATKFAISDNKLIINEPWPGATQPLTYTPPISARRIVATSTTHLPYLEMLGLADRIVGFPSTRYISSPAIRQLVADGKITDLGPDGNINLELLISLQPDVVFAFDMGNESTMLDKIKEAGIEVVYDTDFLETSALGRAEWLKFFGAYFHKEEKADSIFNSIELRYDSLKSLAKEATHHPTIFSGVMYGDVWFLPGGENWSAGFYKDAGGHYLWAEDSASGWLELSFEAVLEKAHKADYWIGTGTFHSQKEILDQDSRYGAFDAFKNGSVFNYSKRSSPSGGYDFFESAYTRPDLVLSDLISILHPELMPGYQTYYFEQIR